MLHRGKVGWESSARVLSAWCVCARHMSCVCVRRECCVLQRTHGAGCIHGVVMCDLRSAIDVCCGARKHVDVMC